MKLSQNLAISRYQWAEVCLKKLLHQVNSPVVSDIGAGNGQMKSITESSGGVWQGFDLIPQKPEIHHWNLDFPMPSHFQSPGIIIMLDVLEHLNNPWLGVQNLANTLLPDGYLILTMPNPKWSRSRFYNLASGYLACFTQSDLDLNHHVFTPWPHIIERLLEDIGFTIEDYVTLDGKTTLPRSPYNFRYPLRFAFSLMNIMLEKYDPTACGMSYGILAKKSR
ncbi:methyltransferase domain-containing protein [Synechocystis salina LEGE 06155]|nr:methyltransferase domain-containing protein [Synechocystis salina LEGE 06155]